MKESVAGLSREDRRAVQRKGLAALASHRIGVTQRVDRLEPWMLAIRLAASLNDGGDRTRAHIRWIRLEAVRAWREMGIAISPERERDLVEWGSRVIDGVSAEVATGANPTAITSALIRTLLCDAPDECVALDREVRRATVACEAWVTPEVEAAADRILRSAAWQ